MEPTQGTEQPGPAGPPEDRTFRVPEESRSSRVWQKVGGLVFALVVIGLLLVATGGHPIRGKSSSKSKSRTTTSATVAAPTSTVPLDLEGAVISTAALADFDVACRSLGLAGADEFCRCVRLRLPGRVLAKEVDGAAAFIFGEADAMPERVRAVMDSCTPAPAPGSVPAAGAPGAAAPTTRAA